TRPLRWPTRHGSRSAGRFHILFFAWLRLHDVRVWRGSLSSVAIQFRRDLARLRISNGVSFYARTRDRQLSADESFRGLHFPELVNGAALFAHRHGISAVAARRVYFTAGFYISNIRTHRADRHADACARDA